MVAVTGATSVRRSAYRGGEVGSADTLDDPDQDVLAAAFRPLRKTAGRLDVQVDRHRPGPGRAVDSDE